MLKQVMVAAVVTAMTLAPVYAQDHKDWCTDAHMQKMDAMIADMTDAAKKQSAQMHLDESKAAMNKGDTAGCIEHMKEAHKDMGL